MCCFFTADATISKDEFVRYKCLQYEALTGESVPEAEAAYVSAQFDLMDVDTDGSIDWWEFVCFEARKYIASKSEVNGQCLSARRFDRWH